MLSSKHFYARVLMGLFLLPCNLRKTCFMLAFIHLELLLHYIPYRKEMHRITDHLLN